VGNFVEDGEVYPLDILYYGIFKKLGLRLRNRLSGVLDMVFMLLNVFLVDMRQYYGLQKVITIYSTSIMFEFHQSIQENVILRVKKGDNFLVIH
jgi:hypothetical protein